MTRAEDAEISFRRALEDPQGAEAALYTEATTLKAGNTNTPSLGTISIRQSYIWTSIVLAIVLFFSVMSLLFMDLGRDTILYAKFLRVDDKQPR